MLQSFARQILRHTLSIPSQIALRAINIPAVEAKLLESYERTKETHKQNLPKLFETDGAIVDGLQDHGVTISSLSHLGLPGTAEMFDALKSLAEHYSKSAKDSTSHGQGTVIASAEEILRYPEIFRWGLNERLLNIVENYLGLPIAYDGINIFYTVADGRQTGTRRWHRDREDRRMIKIAVYQNDVDAEGGPLQIVHSRFPGSKVASEFSYPVLSNEELEARLGTPIRDCDVTTCTGPAGTVIFSDTASHFHRGKPAVSRDRCAVYFHYFARVPRHPFFCERSGLSRAQIAQLSANLSARQRACVLWRDALPPFARIVPPSLV